MLALAALVVVRTGPLLLGSLRLLLPARLLLGTGPLLWILPGKGATPWQGRPEAEGPARGRCCWVAGSCGEPNLRSDQPSIFLPPSSQALVAASRKLSAVGMIRTLLLSSENWSFTPLTR